MSHRTTIGRARRVGRRDLRRRRELAMVLRHLPRPGAVRPDLACHRQRACPVLFQLVDFEQRTARGSGVAGALQLLERLLGAVEDAGLEVVLAELEQRRQLLLLAQADPLEQVLVHADGAVVLAAAAEQAAEREMQFDRLRVDLDHLDERLDRLVGLLVEEEVEALEVRARQRARLLQQMADVDPRRHPAEAEEQRQQPQQPPVVEFHG